MIINMDADADKYLSFSHWVFLFFTQKEFISRMKVVKTIERLTKVKNEFDSAECEVS